MKKFAFFALFSFILLSSVNIYPYEVTGTVVPIVKKTLNWDTPQYLYDNTKTVGNFSNSNEEKIYRSMIIFEISKTVPVNETITSVRLVYDCLNYLDYTNRQLNFTLLNSELKTTYYSDVFNEIEQGSLLGTVPYIMSFNNSPNPWGEVISDDLTNAIINFSRGEIRIGVYSANENLLGSYAKYSFKLYIETSNSAPQYARMKVQNNFGNKSYLNGYAGGLIIVDGATKETPVYFHKAFGENTTFQAVSGQMAGSYELTWADNVDLNKSEWQKINSSNAIVSLTNNLNSTYTSDGAASSDDGSTFTANFRRICNITAQRQSLGGGIVKIIKDGQEYSSTNTPLTKNVVEKNKITLKAETETVENIDYKFQAWKNESGNIVSTNPSYDIYPEFHSTYTAVFKGYANISMMNVQDNGLAVGENCRITWTDNPNSNVYYKIYRSPGLQGEVWAFAGTVQKGVQSYTDGYHIVSGSKESDYCGLRVEAAYSVENTDTLVAAVMFNAEEVAWKTSAKNGKDAVITKYAIANYPNPFNPTTIINYQVPESGHVTVKVYDVMGKEIATLVDGAKNKGSYNISFSMDQYHLSSGIYFCRMQAGKNITTTKMILSK